MVNSMFYKLTLLLIVFTFTTLAFADKPEWAGEGKPPTREQVESHKDEMTSKHSDKRQDKKNKKDKEDKEDKKDKEEKEDNEDKKKKKNSD